MPRKILFIVNPNAGKKISDAVIRIIRKEFPENIYYQIAVWKSKAHFDEIASLLKSEGYTDAVAVGGDGTVNRVAAELIGSQIRLGILPVGSGNGLARSLGISMDLEDCIRQIVAGREATIDCGVVNGQAFFCTSGVGFDAHIAWLFAQSHSRGLSTYIRMTVTQLLRYRPQEYLLKLDGQDLRKKAFLITVANAGQYGNDFYIAPQARLNDGLFHVALLKPFSIFQLPLIFLRILFKAAHTSSFIETYTASSIDILRNAEGSVHFDGEPITLGASLHYNLKPGALRVIIGTPTGSLEAIS